MKLFIAASALIGLAASMPVSNKGDAAIVARQPPPACRPNFQGTAVRVTSELANNYVWTVSPDANVGSSVYAELPSHAIPAAWSWQIDGSPANLYNARSVLVPPLFVSLTLTCFPPDSLAPLQTTWSWVKMAHVASISML